MFQDRRTGTRKKHFNFIFIRRSSKGGKLIIFFQSKEFFVYLRVFGFEILPTTGLIRERVLLMLENSKKGSSKNSDCIDVEIFFK